MTLELEILSEQKAAKIIALLEELRRDNPPIANRVDEEAEALSMPADPQAVLDVIKDIYEAMLNDEVTEIAPGSADRVLA